MVLTFVARLPGALASELGRHAVALRLVESNALRDPCACFVQAARSPVDVVEIDESVGSGIEEVGRLADGHRLPCEAFGLVEATLPRHDLRPHSSPDDLREEVVPGGELLADLREFPASSSRPCA